MKFLTMLLATCIVTNFTLSNNARAEVYHARGSGYYPANTRMEGGAKDRRGRRLYTLQQYLNGNAPYVSVAMDAEALPYGTIVQIPELDRFYGKQIEFRVVDTGDAFIDKGTSRVDICTQNRAASLHPVINSDLRIVVAE